MAFLTFKSHIRTVLIEFECQSGQYDSFLTVHERKSLLGLLLAESKTKETLFMEIRNAI